MKLVQTDHFLEDIDTELIERVLKDMKINLVYQCRFVAGNFIKILWPIIDKFVYCLVPFCIITLINVLIILNISKTQKYKYIVYVSKIKSDDSEKIELSSKNSSYARTNRMLSRELSYNTFLTKNKSVQSNLKSMNRFSNQGENTKPFSKKITFMLLCVSFVFLILTLPVVILYVLLDTLKQLIENSTNPEQNYEWLSIAQKVTTLLMHLNHSINFFIYYLTGARFRQKFRYLIRTQKSKSSYFQNQQVRNVGQNVHFNENDLNNRIILKKNSALYA